MQIIFYPGKPDHEPHTGLSRVVYQELRKKSETQWNKMDLWILETKRNDVSQLRDSIIAESKKPQQKRKLSPLGDGLYEYRGKQSIKGTIRLYFCYDETTVYILAAEFKTGAKNMIDIARERKKEINL
jgi:hypothetical protein